jgi:hypothetical protein
MEEKRRGACTCKEDQIFSKFEDESPHLELDIRVASSRSAIDMSAETKVCTSKSTVEDAIRVGSR